MKKFFITSAFFLFIAAIFQSSAQTEKGKAFFGASTNFSVLSTQTKLKLDGDVEKVGKSSSVNFSPEVGFFIANGFALGVKFDIDSQKDKFEPDNDEYKSTTTQIGLIVKHYGGSSKVKPIIQLGIGLASESVEVENDKSRLNGFGYEIMGGIDVFLNQNISIDLIAGYSAINVSNKDLDDVRVITGGFDLNFGFNIFL